MGHEIKNSKVIDTNVFNYTLSEEEVKIRTKNWSGALKTLKQLRSPRGAGATIYPMLKEYYLTGICPSQKKLKPVLDGAYILVLLWFSPNSTQEEYHRVLNCLPTEREKELQLKRAAALFFDASNPYSTSKDYKFKPNYGMMGGKEASLVKFFLSDKVYRYLTMNEGRANYRNINNLFISYCEVITLLFSDIKRLPRNIELPAEKTRIDKIKYQNIYNPYLYIMDGLNTELSEYLTDYLKFTAASVRWLPKLFEQVYYFDEKNLPKERKEIASKHCQFIINLIKTNENLSRLWKAYLFSKKVWLLDSFEGGLQWSLDKDTLYSKLLNNYVHEDSVLAIYSISETMLRIRGMTREDFIEEQKTQWAGLYLTGGDIPNTLLLNEYFGKCYLLMPLLLTRSQLQASYQAIIARLDKAEADRLLPPAKELFLTMLNNDHEILSEIEKFEPGKIDSLKQFFSIE